MWNSKIFLSLLLVLGSFGVAYAATGAMLDSGDNGTYMIVADAREAVHDENGGIVRDESSGTCVRTKWMDNYDVCASEAIKPEVEHKVEQQKRLILSREERTVYFPFNQASLSPEMQQRLDTLALTLKSDSQVSGARIVGYADRIGSADYNEKLSQLRAETVKEYLTNKGLLNTRVADTRWVGSQMPTTDCPSNLKRPDLINCLQNDRRVEVEIDYVADLRASR